MDTDTEQIKSTFRLIPRRNLVPGPATCQSFHPRGRYFAQHVPRLVTTRLAVIKQHFISLPLVGPPRFKRSTSYRKRELSLERGRAQESGRLLGKFSYLRNVARERESHLWRDHVVTVRHDGICTAFFILFKWLFKDGNDFFMQAGFWNEKYLQRSIYKLFIFIKATISLK